MQNMGKDNCNIFVIAGAKEKPAVFLAGVVGVVVVVLLFAFGGVGRCVGKFIAQFQRHFHEIVPV